MGKIENLGLNANSRDDKRCDLSALYPLIANEKDLYLITSGRDVRGQMKLGAEQPVAQKRHPADLGLEEVGIHMGPNESVAPLHGHVFRSLGAR